MATNSSTSCTSQCVEGTTLCSVHADEEVTLSCKTCRKLICLQCVIKSGKHHNHDYELLNKALLIKCKERSLRPLDMHVATVDKALEQIDKR